MSFPFIALHNEAQGQLWFLKLCLSSVGWIVGKAFVLEILEDIDEIEALDQRTLLGHSAGQFWTITTYLLPGCHKACLVMKVSVFSPSAFFFLFILGYLVV